MSLVPDAMHMWQPALTAMRAAVILVTMPPEPTSDLARPAMASISGVMRMHALDEARVRVAIRIGGVQAVDIR